MDGWMDGRLVTAAINPDFRVPENAYTYSCKRAYNLHGNYNNIQASYLHNVIIELSSKNR